MQSAVFNYPVIILVGMGYPREIRSVFEAYQFLTDWAGNSPEQRAALRACRAALVGDIDPETARGIFVAFAEKKDLLLPEFVVGSIQRTDPRAAGLEAWSLSGGYPMSASNYAAKRSELAKKLGLGRKPKGAIEPSNHHRGPTAGSRSGRPAA
jgi:Protein of unknown function (DUF982)/ROS/MUCR transcriptional regulator protein